MQSHRESRQDTSFSGDMFKIVSGTTVAQFLGILLSPLLTRLYPPEAFGLLAVFTSIIAIVGVIACMRYELAIMLPERDEDGANLLGLSLGIVILISILIVLFIWRGSSRLMLWLNTPKLLPDLWLLPLGILSTGAFLALNYWNSRTRKFGRLSMARVTTAFVTILMQLGAGYAGYTTAGPLIGASVLGQVITATVLGAQIWRDESNLFLESIRWRTMLSGACRYAKFPLYSTWSALLNTASWKLPALLLSMFFSSTIVGYYVLGFRVLQMPMSLIGSAIGQVFFQRASEAHNQGKLTILVEQVLQRLMYIGLFPLLLLALIGRDLYGIVFGQNWSEAGFYTQILSVFMFFNFIAAPLGQLFSILEQQEVALVTNILLFCSRLLALCWGGKTGNIVFTLGLFSVSGVLVYGGYSIWISASAGIPPHKWLMMFLRVLLLCGGFLIPPWLICMGCDLRAWSLLAVYSVAFLSYYGWVMRHDAEIYRMVSGFIYGVRRK